MAENKYSANEIDKRNTDNYNKLLKETINYYTAPDVGSATSITITPNKNIAGTGIVFGTASTPTYTRASESLLRQTIGKKRDPYQTSLFDALLEDQEHREKAIENNIEDIGAQLSVSARYALHAIQTKFTHTDYKGNSGSGVLRMTIPEYLDAYGVTKKNLGRDKLEYNPKERKDALEALLELNKPILWYVKKINKTKTKKEGKKFYDIVKGIDPILRVKKGYQGLSEEEAEKVTSGHELDKKLSHLEITPSEIFLGSSFVLLPEPIFRNIKLRYKKVSKHFLTFVTYLFIEANHKNYTLKRYYPTLVDTLHLNYLEKTRQNKRIVKSLEEDFQKAKEIELLKSYQIGSDIKGQYVELELNPASFYQKKKLKDKEGLEKLA